jgi:hypothetical protein
MPPATKKQDGEFALDLIRAGKFPALQRIISAPASDNGAACSASPSMADPPFACPPDVEVLE